MMSESSEPDFHIPMGALFEKDGESYLLYTLLLTVGSPQLLHQHVMTVLDAHAGNWMNTEFSGRVLLNCWNDDVDDEDCDTIRGGLEQSLDVARRVIESNGIASNDGNPIVIQSTFTNKMP